MSCCYMKLYNINTFRYCSALSLCLCTLCLISSILMPLEAVVGEIKSEPFIFIHPGEGQDQSVRNACRKMEGWTDSMPQSHFLNENSSAFDAKCNKKIHISNKYNIYAMRVCLLLILKIKKKDKKLTTKSSIKDSSYMMMKIAAT